jgi:hypothetical protein
VLIGVGGCKGCSGCGPDLPTDLPVDSSDSDTDTGDSAIDTEPQPPCDVPEVEPNDAFDAGTPLPLELTGCGVFDEGIDLDRWDVDFPNTAWLGLHVDAYAIGSSSDPTLTLTSDDGQVAQVGGETFGEDIHLVFPSLPDTYRLLLTDQNATGGEDYLYEILATHTKAPVVWNLLEDEPNDSRTEPQDLFDGDDVFGMIESSSDRDWYRITVPSGPHVVTLDVDAYEYGAAANFRLVMYDESETEIGDYFAGENAWDPDPLAERTSTGDEVWYVRIREQNNRAGRAYWYLLKVSVEEK